MENNSINKHAPCLETNCSFCCNPVKIEARRALNMDLPKNDEGEELWAKRPEILATESLPDIKIYTYDCKNFDGESGRCIDYENRPNICRNTTCISDPNGDLAEQQKKIAKQEFLEVKPISFKLK